MNITINLTGLDTLAASIDNLANALKAGVKADQIIDVAKASSRKPKPVAPEAGNVSTPTDSATPDTATLIAETPKAAPAPSTPASPSNVTIVEVRAAIAALAKTDKERALAILAKHGAASVSALKEEFFAEALAEATK